MWSPALTPCPEVVLLASPCQWPREKWQAGAQPPVVWTAALLVAMRYGCHYSHCRRCDGRVGQSRRHDQEGGVSIVGEAGPRRGRQGPCHQDCCSRSAARRAPEYGHPHRSVVCTHLWTAERLAHSSRTHQNEWRGRQSGRGSELGGEAAPVSPPLDRHARSHMPHRLLHRRARGQRKDRQVLGRVVTLAAAPSHRAGSKSKHSQVPILRRRDRAHRERDAPHAPQRQGALVNRPVITGSSAKCHLACT